MSVLWFCSTCRQESRCGDVGDDLVFPVATSCNVWWSWQYSLFCALVVWHVFDCGVSKISWSTPVVIVVVLVLVSTTNTNENMHRHTQHTHAQHTITQHNRHFFCVTLREPGARSSLFQQYLYEALSFLCSVNWSDELPRGCNHTVHVLKVFFFSVQCRVVCA